MSFLSVESNKKVEILEVTLRCSIPHHSTERGDRIVGISPINIGHGDHEILGDFIIRQVSHLKMTMTEKVSEHLSIVYSQF